MFCIPFDTFQLKISFAVIFWFHLSSLAFHVPDDGFGVYRCAQQQAVLETSHECFKARRYKSPLFLKHTKRKLLTRNKHADILMLFVPAPQPKLSCCVALRAALLQNQRHTCGSAAPAGPREREQLGLRGKCCHLLPSPAPSLLPACQQALLSSWLGG